MRARLLRALALVSVVGACSSAPGPAPAPTFADPAAGAAPLVERFFSLIHDKDTDGLRAFLAPSFQIQRANGTGTTKDEYLQNLADVETWSNTDLVATQSGNVLVVRYLSTVTGTVNGAPYTPGPAPRLSIFAWNGTDWQIVAHANFNPLEG